MVLCYKINHDISARDKLIKSNLKYTCSLAKRFKGQGVPYSDLISEANFGLIEALDKYDIKQDVKLISYAKWWIIQKMQIAIFNNSKIQKDELPNEKNLNDKNDDENYKINENYINDESYNKILENNEIVENLMSCLTEQEYDVISMYFGRLNYDDSTLEEIGKKYKVSKERIRQIIERSKMKMRAYALTSKDMSEFKKRV